MTEIANSQDLDFTINELVITKKQILLFYEELNALIKEFNSDQIGFSLNITTEDDEYIRFDDIDEFKSEITSNNKITRITLHIVGFSDEKKSIALKLTKNKGSIYFNSTKKYWVDQEASKYKENLKNTLFTKGIYIEENRGINKLSEENEEVMPKLFVSHYSGDKEIVGCVIELLEGLGFTKENMFCSSFSPYNIPLGQNPMEYIKKQFKSNPITTLPTTVLNDVNKITYDEITLLQLMLTNEEGPFDITPAWTIKEGMRDSGLNEFSYSLAIRKLLIKGFIEVGTVCDNNDNNCIGYNMTENGNKYIVENFSTDVFETRQF